MKREDINKRFAYCPPKDKQVGKYHVIRRNGKKVAENINEMCPDGREKDLAITKLEEAIMWANASIARNRKGSDE